MLFSVQANAIMGPLPAQGYTMMPLMFSRPPLVAGHNPPSSLDHTQPHGKPKYGLLSLSTLVQVSSDPSPLTFFHTTSRGHIAVSDVATNNGQTMIDNYDEQRAGEQLHTHPSPFHFLTQEAGATLVSAMWQPNMDEQRHQTMMNGGQHPGELLATWRP
jgi:hypothetical protein